MFVDFDGTLSAIVRHPDLALPAEGTREALAALVGRYRVVAVITGRRTGDVESRLAVPGVRYLGSYGMTEGAGPVPHDVVEEAERAAGAVPSAWVEAKGATVSVHYRETSDPSAARAALAPELASVAERAGLDLIEGKMVLELVPRGGAMKGGAVERVAAEQELEAALFAGDDVADLDAFAALDRLAARGLETVKVAVRGPETPGELVSRADVAVDGPAGLVALLRSL